MRTEETVADTDPIVDPATGSVAREVLVPKEQLHGLVEAIRGGAA